MHKISDHKGPWVGFLSVASLAAANATLPALPSLYHLSPASQSYWVLQLEVLRPLKYPFYVLGLDPTDPVLWAFFWLGVSIAVWLVARVRLAWFAGLLCAAGAIYSLMSLYAASRHGLALADGGTRAAGLTTLLLLVVFLATAYGFAAVSRSYMAAMRQS